MQYNQKYFSLNSYTKGGITGTDNLKLTALRDMECILVGDNRLTAISGTCTTIAIPVQPQQYGSTPTACVSIKKGAVIQLTATAWTTTSLYVGTYDTDNMIRSGF